MNGAAAQSFLAILARDPAVYPFQVDLVGDQVFLASIPLERQAEAIFLDQRALTPQTKGAWAPWREVARAAREAHAGNLAYLLHAGHCGSTLLSRLIEAATGARALREPLPLRALAEDAADARFGASFLTSQMRAERLAVLERIWSRGGAVIKATSICCGLVDEFRSDAPVAFIYVRPEIFLTLLLGGANTHLDLRNFAKMRVRRMLSKTRLPTPLETMTPGELAAMSWLVEASSIAAAKRRVIDVNFDRFLADPAPALSALCRALGFPADDAAVGAAIEGPIMRRYAKAPEIAYDASTRAEIIAEDGVRCREEINRGLRWLEHVGATFPAGDEALSRFGAP